ncbi:MAG: two-component system, NtrC family, sensor kinase [Gammaproteobacteria bacterium]|nr:two-component system, NtrC family, sensor kinase [Gammaproteobacteria bacterium]
MNGPRRFSWLAMAGLVSVLASILVFLYVRTNAHDASSYFENIVLLRQLKQLDARWELDVLKSRMGIDTSYDSLVDPLAALNHLQQRLQSDMASQYSRDAGKSSRLNATLHRAIDEKTRLVEHFKSHNSVLRNSLAFLPTAANDIGKSLRQSVGDSVALRGISTDVSQLLLKILVFSQSPSDEAAVDIRAQLEHLDSDKRHLPAERYDELDIFASHVRAVLTEQPAVNGLLREIAAVPTAAGIDALDNLLSGDQRETEILAQQYRKYLLIFAAALVALLLYAAVGLIRSHAEINRVNRELQVANATLEERVRERTRELHEAQSELVTTARKAGMAEIANNVLHNVGNVLNSVNVSAGLIGGRIRDSKVSGLSKAVQLLDEHLDDLGTFLAHDPRGKALPGYLTKLVATLADEKQSIAAELDTLTRSIDHIKEIVATQHTYSGASSVLESVRVEDLLEDVLRMNAASVARHRIEVIKDFAAVPMLRLDKHLLLQILVNLLSNSRRAMDGVLDRPHRVALRMRIIELVDENRLQIRVEDNGEGIAPENLSRLFSHGFTTRKNGHGFGLHSSALAAKEMGGTLRAHSDGPGKGAVFSLELPLNPAEDVMTTLAIQA